MYQKFYGLREDPFNLTPDSNFLFPSKRHKEALAHLIYGIESRKGFIMVTGEVGTGKTTLCRALLSKLDESIEVAFIMNPTLSELELLEAINDDLGIRASKEEAKKELIDNLNDFLFTQKMLNKNVVILIDECQNLAIPTLEQIRMLSNLETEKEKLLQIILVGQPEFQKNLSSPALRQLDQRITVRCYLQPLDFYEMQEYIYHRLKVAGLTNGLKFTRGAMKMIYTFSDGVPRLVNVICEYALLGGYVEETRTIGKKIVLNAIREVRGKGEITFTKKKRFFLFGLAPLRIFRMATVGVVLFVFLAWGSAYFTRDGSGAFNRQLTNYLSSFRRINIQGVFGGIASSVRGSLFSFMSTAQTKSRSALESAAILLRYWESEMRDFHSLKKEVIGEEGAVDFEKLARLHGMDVVFSWAELGMLQEISVPCILELEYEEGNRYVVLKELTDETAIIVDGQGQEKYVTTAELDRLRKGNAIIFCKDIYKPNLVLYQTMRGSGVKQLQRQLQMLGYILDVKNEGFFDRMTNQAVLRFQQNHGLSADGVVGPEMKLILYSLLKEKEAQ